MMVEVKINNLFRVTVTGLFLDSGDQREFPELTRYFDNRPEAIAYARTQDQTVGPELFYQADVERV
jgi:hypothetical protein